MGILAVGLGCSFGGIVEEGGDMNSGAELPLRFGGFDTIDEATLELPDGAVFVVESSSDLVEWTPRGEFERASVDAGMLFFDLLAPDVERQFYRLRSVDSIREAHIRAVSVSGDSGAYRFSVTVTSPDLGCDQYADWWEVLSLEGDLLGRRVLAHSHVDEQPFTRSGNATPIESTEIVLIRAHMNTTEYGGVGLIGSVATGFRPVLVNQDFSYVVASEAPLPSGCAF